MKKVSIKKTIASLSIFTTIAFSSYIPTSLACTRVLYTGKGSIVMTGRTTDWASDINTNIWAFPRGMHRNGSAGEGSIEWTSKYGSVVTAVVDVLPIDGMNEKGLVVNMLHLKESKYLKPLKNDLRKPLSISMWAQYVLDNFATVNEAVNALSKEPFYIATIKNDDGTGTGLHLAISDPKGDSAIFEYIDGKLKIHHGKEYKVLTNSPEFDKQLAINQYWQERASIIFPGTNNASDRFARSSYYIKTVPQVSNEKEAFSIILSIIRAASTPLGLKAKPDEQSVSPTLWRTISDQKNKIYYFESTHEKNIFWINLKDMNFKEDQPIKRLDFNNGKYYSGNAAKEFKDMESFTFAPAGLQVKK